jgi:hypothetical protein
MKPPTKVCSFLILALVLMSVAPWSELGFALRRDVPVSQVSRGYVRTLMGVGLID